MSPSRIAKWFVVASLFVATSAVQAAEKLAIVVGPKAPAIEQLAAKELAAQVDKLFDVEAVVVDEIPKTGPAIVVRSLKLPSQAIAIRSEERDGRPVLIVGGGSPAAALWAVYELGYRWGVRYLLHEDSFPAKGGAP